MFIRVYVSRKKEKRVECGKKQKKTRFLEGEIKKKDTTTANKSRFVLFYMLYISV